MNVENKVSGEPPLNSREFEKVFHADYSNIIYCVIVATTDVVSHVEFFVPALYSTILRND